MGTISTLGHLLGIDTGGLHRVVIVMAHLPDITMIGVLTEGTISAITICQPRGYGQVGQVEVVPEGINGKTDTKMQIVSVFFAKKFCNVGEKLYLCRIKIKSMERKEFFEALFGLLSEVSDALRELADELEDVKYDCDSPNVTTTWDVGQCDDVCCHTKKRFGCGFNIDEPLFEEEDCY